MIESRNLNDLLPIVKMHAIAAIARAEVATGLSMIVTATYRDDEMQRLYYQQHKTKDMGPKAPHSLRVAVDIAPAIKNVDGRKTLCYDTPLWPIIAKCFKEEHFEWGGDWIHFVDKPHFQWTKFQSLDQIRNGVPVKES